MKLIKFFEKNLSWLQIKRLPMILCIGYFVFFILTFSGLIGLDQIVLQWADINSKKEYWRLFTYIFYIPSHPLFIYFAIMIQWITGSALEGTWGSLKFTLFFYFSCLLTIGLAIAFPAIVFTDWFAINVFIVFTFYYPNYTFLLFFILPVKVKWLAYLTWIGLALSIVNDKFSLESLIQVLPVIIPISFFVGQEFFLKIKYKTKREVIATKKQIATKKFRHQCKVCKTTDLLEPFKEFRYIEENGATNCYCEPHIPTKKNY